MFLLLKIRTNLRRKYVENATVMECFSTNTMSALCQVNKNDSVRGVKRAA